jgi:hypothetical protein
MHRKTASRSGRPGVLRSAPWLFGAVAAAALIAFPARKATARVTCDQVTGGSAFFTQDCCDDAPAGGTEATIHAGDEVDVMLIVRLASGKTEDVTGSANTSFASGGSGDFFDDSGGGDEEYASSEADAGHAFPLYLIYQDPCNGTFHTYTLHLDVLPSTP